MGLFDGKEKKVMADKFHEMDVMKHQIMDLMDLLKKTNERLDKLEKDVGDAHQALGILDGDFSDLKGSVDGKYKAVEQKLKTIELGITDLKLIGRLAIENREEIDTIMNILKKIAEPEFKEVFIAHDSELDRFKQIEMDIDELKDRGIIVERPTGRKTK